MLALLAARPGLAQEDLAPSHDPAERAIGFYQSYLSSLRHFRCRFSPSCSEYARLAIQTYGLAEGSARATDRLMRCNASAGRFYPRDAERRLIDLPGSPALGPLGLRAPEWLLPAAITSLDSSRVASGPNEIVSFAEALAAEGDCYRAATEFRRAAHLAGTDEAHAWAHAAIARCFYREGEWALSEASFLNASMLEPAPHRARELCLAAGASRFARGEYAAAEAVIAECAGPDSVASSPGRQKSLGLLGLCSLARGHWDTAARRFDDAAAGEAVSTGAGARSHSFESLAAAARQGPELPSRSPGLATALSAILPGAGQTYAGRTQEGWRHLLFNAALIWTVVDLTRDRRYTAAYLVSALELPFYAGNILGARSAARAFNRARRIEHAARAIEAATRGKR